MDKTQNHQQHFHSLDDIAARREELLKGMNKDQKEIGLLWNAMFKPEKKTRQKGFTLSSVLSSSVGIIDGALFALKIYRKFKR